LLDPVTQLVWAAGGMLAGMTLLWLIQRFTRDAGIVDVGWSAGVGLCAVFFAATCGQTGGRHWIIAGATALWSFRLASYLLRDRVIGKPEDGRYQALRKEWGVRADWFFLCFFWAQGGLAVLFAVAPWIAIHAPRTGSEQWLGLNAWDFAGVAVWLVAIVGEHLADNELAKFRANPVNKGKVCRAGLWQYSRHPNYFFEWLHWWAYVLFGVGSPWWWGTLVMPALMLIFLFRVTGIPATEAQALRSRGEEYREYQRTTSAFVPWWPKP
jgi:steroid 5-alpha reductase family enzyme